MGYGTSLGTAHEDEISYVMEKGLTDKQFADQSEINQNSTSGDFQSRFGASDAPPKRVYITGSDDSTMPLEASRKLTDALKAQGGTQTPEKPPETNSPLPGPLGRLSIVNAFKGMSAGAEDAVTNFPQHIKEGIDSVIKMVKTPGEGFENKLPPFVQDPDTGETKVNPQAIEWATNTAMTMIGAPAPVAAKMADGTLGSFMGVKSKTIDKTKLYKAQEMEMNGAHPDDIWNDTGTFRGADNRWRQEVNDKTSKLKEEHLNVTTAEPERPSWSKIEAAPKTVAIPSRFEGLNNAKTLEDLMKSLASRDAGQKVLGHILDHPKLYDAYPWLQNIKVYPLPKDSPYYGMARGGNEIHMAELTPDQFHSTLMHEVQHIIQTHEGFAQGSNPSMFLPKELAAAEENFLKIREEALSNTERELGNATRVGEMQRAVRAELEGVAKPGGIHYERISFLKEKHPEIYQRLSNIAKSEKLLEEAKDKANRMYKSTMGEVESRNVQARMDMDAVMRHLTSPRVTEEYQVPRSLQHDPHRVDPRTGVSASIPGEFTPASPRWPHNDNARPLNEHEQFFKDYDELHALGNRLGTPKTSKLKGFKDLGEYRVWSELDYAKYNKAARELAKKYGHEHEDLQFDPLNTKGLRKD